MGFPRDLWEQEPDLKNCKACQELQLKSDVHAWASCHWPGSSCSSLVLSSSLQSPCKALTPGRPSKAPPHRTRSSLTEILSLCLSLKPTGPAIPLHLSTCSHLTGRGAVPSSSLAEKNLFLPTCQGSPFLSCAGLKRLFPLGN